MLGLKVSINGGEAVIGGTEDLGVLNASVNASGELGPASVHPRPGEPPDLWMRLGGLTSRADADTDEHLGWLWEDLNVGDRVVIEIVEVESADPPVERKPREKKG